MGAWGIGISSNDTYADIYDEFFELYNEGLDVQSITTKLLETNQEIINEPGKSGDVDHPYPVQNDHLKLRSFSCIKRAAFIVKNSVY